MERNSISLCMIVRDSARTLPACLESIRPWVDEMVIVDTGSVDNTPEIAATIGAKLFHFPWCDDFAKARNESLRHARGTWLFWMDSDDTIDAENGRKLRQLADLPLANAPAAYIMQVHCPGTDGQYDVTVVDHVKMFRNHPGLRFEGRIHEQVLAAVRRLQGTLAWTDVFVVHSGSDQTPEGRKRKIVRDLRLLELEDAEKPNHPFVLFNLGMTYADCTEHERAVGYLRRCLGVSGEGESHVRKAYALLASSLGQLERHDEAWAVCERGLTLFPQDAELHFRHGMACHSLNRHADSVSAYRAALRNGAERHFSSMDRGIVGFKARHNLAIVYADMGRDDLAEIQWRRAIEEVPRYVSAWRGLGDCLLRQRKVVTLEAHLEFMANDPLLACEALLMEAQLANALGDIARADAALGRAVVNFPDQLPALRARCQFLFEQGRLDEAAAELTEVCARDPQDGAEALHRGWKEVGEEEEGYAGLCPGCVEQYYEPTVVSEDSSKHLAPPVHQRDSDEGGGIRAQGTLF